MADKGLIAASASLAKSQIPVDLAGEFMKTFGEATKKFEADRQAIISTVSDYMGRLKTDIDFTSMAPAMETEVRGFLTNRKNEYAELANQVAKLKDPSSKEYQTAVDRMNDIQREFQILSKELATYNQQKVDFAADFKDPQNAFSGANSDADLAAYRDIYGLSENGVAPVIIDNGHLQFNVGGKIKRYDSMEDLLRPDNTPLIIAEQAANYSGLNREITQKELDFESAQLDTLFKNNKSFASLIFDAPKELELFEIREEYIKAREEGKLEELLPELKNRAKDIIINGYKDTALESKAAYDARTATIDSPNDPPNKDLNRRQRNTASLLEYEKQAFKPTPGLVGANKSNDVIVITTSTGTPYDVQMINGKWLLSKGDEEWTYDTFDAMKAARTDLFE
jgi:hypothetical protein